MKATVYTTDTDEDRSRAIQAAQEALQAKKTLVIPTDTVYGIAADAFAPEAVASLLAAKGRSRTMPPPVLIFDEAVLPGLADEVSAHATALARRFWPGALTLIFYSQPSLNWDLGESQGTVALRVPHDSFTIDLLRQTGPLAVSSANKTGRIAATTAQEAAQQLGNDVELIIDAGTRPLARRAETRPADVLPSTIVDCTSDRPVVVREGAISLAELREVVPEIVSRAELEGAKRPAARHLAPSTEAEHTPSGQNSGLGSGPRAGAPQPDSISAGLVTATSSEIQVDQMRTKEAHRLQQHRQSLPSTQPVPVEEARALVFAENAGDPREEEN